MSACVNRLLSLATLSKLMFEQPPSEIICQFVRAPKYSKPLSVMLVHPRKSRWVKLVMETNFCKPASVMRGHATNLRQVPEAYRRLNVGIRLPQAQAARLPPCHPSL